VKLPVIVPDWPAPTRVKAAVTTRCGGVSAAPWDSLNLAVHVGDEPARVYHNRQYLCRSMGLHESRIGWLEQVHGTEVVELPVPGVPVADAASTRMPQTVCVVMVADCLPVLFCDRDGDRVAAAHAGWRGLAGGILEQTLSRFSRPDDVMAYLGPAIGPAAFEVGAEVRQAFLAQDSGAEHCFESGRDGRFMADLYELARRRLARAGVRAVYGGDFCTFTDKDRFFSYRRDGRTGRQVALIWLAP